MLAGRLALMPIIGLVVAGVRKTVILVATRSADWVARPLAATGMKKVIFTLVFIEIAGASYPLAVSRETVHRLLKPK